jgi:hypothetical protein
VTEGKKEKAPLREPSVDLTKTLSGMILKVMREYDPVQLRAFKVREDVKNSYV